VTVVPRFPWELLSVRRVLLQSGWFGRECAVPQRSEVADGLRPGAPLPPGEPAPVSPSRWLCPPPVWHIPVVGPRYRQADKTGVMDVARVVRFELHRDPRDPARWWVEAKRARQKRHRIVAGLPLRPGRPRNPARLRQDLVRAHEHLAKALGGLTATSVASIVSSGEALAIGTEARAIMALVRPLEPFHPNDKRLPSILASLARQFPHVAESLKHNGRAGGASSQVAARSFVSPTALSVRMPPPGPSQN
jgi:hypothetical protein